MKMEASLFSMAELGKACSTNPIFKTPKAWTAISTYLEKSRSSPKNQRTCCDYGRYWSTKFRPKMAGVFLPVSTNA